MYISITDLKEYFFNFLIEGVNHQQVTRGAAVGAQLSLNKKRQHPKYIFLAVWANFSLCFEVAFGNFTSFLAVLHSFWSHNDGNELRGC